MERKRKIGEGWIKCWEWDIKGGMITGPVDIYPRTCKKGHLFTVGITEWGILHKWSMRFRSRG